MDALLPTTGPLFGRDEILDNTYRIVEGIAAGGMGEITPAPGVSPIVKVIDFGLSTCGWSERVTGDCSVFGIADSPPPAR